jgi:predicted Zn-dependent protease
MTLADGARRAGDRDQESAALLKALDRQPRSPDTLMRLANVYSEKRNYDRAAIYLNRITQINPDSADVYFGLAQAERVTLPLCRCRPRLRPRPRARTEE